MCAGDKQQHCTECAHFAPAPLLLLLLLLQGVHMQSTNKEGTYRNEVVSAVIKSHNLELRGLGSIDNPGSFPTY
jgi:hypothetical protein